MSANIIVAVGNYVVGKGYPIGKNGSIPWKSKADMKWFTEMTVGHPVIMGRKTWESLKKPLKNRLNIVVSHIKETETNDGVIWVSSIEKALDIAKRFTAETPFIIGGGSIYKYALDHDLVDSVYIDILAKNVDNADTFFPSIITDTRWEQCGKPIPIEEGKAYAFCFSRAKGASNNVDSQYLNLVNDIIKNGEKKESRAGATRSLFSKQLRFNLRKGLPMLTTKKMFSKGVIHELLWFLNGETNIKYLVSNDVHIWDDDAYRYYLSLAKSNSNFNVVGGEELSKENFINNVLNGVTIKYRTDKGLRRYTFGDLNNVYGYQWTNWGGHNQVKEVINALKTNPDDRRMIISAWNVADIPDMALPPCHFCCQFYTKKMTEEEQMIWMLSHNKYGETPTKEPPTRKISCVWHQRSVDTLLGLPFNILSYAILTHMIAQCADMDVDELIFDGGDVHVYENQIETFLNGQNNNSPHKYALPTLKLNEAIKDIDLFKYSDIKIEGYESYPSVKYPLSVGL